MAMAMAIGESTYSAGDKLCQSCGADDLAIDESKRPTEQPTKWTDGRAIERAIKRTNLEGTEPPVGLIRLLHGRMSRKHREQDHPRTPNIRLAK